jgi:hypothetical protein
MNISVLNIESEPEYYNCDLLISGILFNFNSTVEVEFVHIVWFSTLLQWMDYRRQNGLSFSQNLNSQIFPFWIGY